MDLSALLKEKLTEVTDCLRRRNKNCIMAVIKSLKNEVKVAAPEIFFRIYILIQSGFSLYCRVLILQWCPKKFVGKEKKFQGFHYCQKVDKKGREIYTQFSNNSLHALI